MNNRSKSSLPMKKRRDNVVPIGQAACQPEGLVLGSIVEITSSGKIMVDFSNSPHAPVQARSIIDIFPDDIDREVLIGFANNTYDLPVIIGRIQPQPLVVEEICLDPEKKKELVIDGKRKILEAEETIELRCGESSILMKKNGKIVIKGTNIVSRSRGANKVKGASVHIN